MLQKLEKCEERYRELEELISQPEVIARQEEWRQLIKEHARLADLVAAFREHKAICGEIAEASGLLLEAPDGETQDWVRQELTSLEKRKGELEGKLRLLLLPRDPRDEKNVIVEIRGGAGGEEAALFAADLFRMYSRYAENQGWTTEVISASDTDIGGFKEIIFSVNGRGAYSRLKYESGVHRVQRIPTTESGGRIHTSTATVAVLPEAEEVELELDPNDLEIDTYTASGPGGQHVNKTESAVRILHRPSGLVVTCQDEKSQHKNKARALKVLRARLLDMLEREQHEELAQARRAQVGSGDRSERIRTYNFPQNRITDHRIGLTLHQLETIMAGELDDLVDPLIAYREAGLVGQA